MQGDDLGDRDGGSAEIRSEFDLRSLLAIVRRRRIIFFVVAVPLLIPAAILPFVLPRYYEATATIALEKRAPVLEIGRDVLSEAGGDMREASIVKLATSDAVLGVVLDQIPDRGPGPRNLEGAVATLLGLGEHAEPSPDQRRQLGLSVLRQVIRISLAGGGDYLIITAKASTAAGSAFLANTLADAYVKHWSDQRESATQRAVAWLNRQIYELRDQTARKEQAAADLISQGLKPRDFSQDGEHESALSRLEKQIQTTRVELMAINQRLAETSPAETAVEADTAESAARERLKAQRDKESANLEAARLKFTPTHPEVRRLEEIVANLRERTGKDAVEHPAALTSEDIAERQALARDKGRLQSKLAVLEKSRDEQLAGNMKSDAYSRYSRIMGEIEIDREMLGVLIARRSESMLASAKKDSGPVILDRAVPPLRQAGPPRKKYLGLGIAVVLAVSLAIAYLPELLDHRLRDPDRIADLLGMPTLCVLPMIRSKKASPERQGGGGPGSPGLEGYRSLRTALMFAMRTRPIHTLLVTSALAGEGKTTTSANLAATFARMGKRVVLVDADMRRPRLHRVFNLPRVPGISEILGGSAKLNDAIVRPQGEAFDMIAAGASPENPTDLLASSEWNDLMRELEHSYELVLIDTPVLLAVPDSLVLAAQVDGVLLVHKPGTLDRRGLNRMRTDLKSAGARVLGIVFNQIDPTDSDLYPAYLESPYVKEPGVRRSFRKSRQ